MSTLRFEWDCESLERAVRRACEHDAYIAYYGDPEGVALWWVRYVVREARRLNLYPSTAQIEAELRRAA